MALTLVPPCDLGTQVSEATRRKETDKETTLPTLSSFRSLNIAMPPECLLLRTILHSIPTSHFCTLLYRNNGRPNAPVV